MKNILKLSLVIILATTLVAEDEKGRSVKEAVGDVLKHTTTKAGSANSYEDMFTNAEITGQLELMYSKNDNKNNPNIYATAVGGNVIYTLAKYKGFNAAAEFSIAHDINTLTGEDTKQNPGISSEDGSYTELSQVYVDYEYDGFSVRLGRQLIDTPLADSDHIRIIDNTFEAVVFNYEQEEFSLTLGYLSRWQGTDAGLDIDNHWQDTGDDGTYFAGISYANDLVDISAWYYDISKSQASNTATGNVANKSAYFDISLHDKVSKNFYLYFNAQYLNQSSQDSSEIESSIYGALFEVVAYKKLAFTLAYNKAQKQSQKGSFSGFGGGTLYTNMDSMIIDSITQDRDAQAIVAGMTYSIGKVGFLYAYGDFDGDKDSQAIDEHIVEQNIGIMYNHTQNLTIAAICTINDDKKDTQSNGGDFTNYRAVLAYKF